MGIRVNRQHLKCEMARRGWTRTKLAHVSGLSASTVNAAMTGRPIHPGSLHQIAQALDKSSALESTDQLIDE